MSNHAPAASNGPSGDVQRLMAELPGGVALFADDGALLEANLVFLAALGQHDDSASFTALFGAGPSAFEGGHGDAVAIDGRHYALTAKRVAGWGWLCQLQDVSSWVVGHAEAQAAAMRDHLTGLPNRGLIVPEVARALAVQAQGQVEGQANAHQVTTQAPAQTPAQTLGAPGQPHNQSGEKSGCALLMIDLDRFKLVNDTLGHSVGDALLKKVGQRLAASVRPTDIAARLGGDEFAVLQTGAAQPTGAGTLAKRLVEVLARPYVVDGHMIDIGTSIGVAVAVAGRPVDGDTLFKQADIALYRAKNAGRGRYTFFEQRMDEEMQERRAIELDLRRALAFRQFELHYQPQLDLATQTITGLEALIRWHHPERGLVPPNDFIRIAEETGLIVPIGEWVIRQACDDAASWPDGLAVAINVSAKQLASGKLVGTVAQAIANSGLAASRVEIEITESVLMADTEGCVATLHALRDLGVSVSMDDFGTGYSSLSYLSSFPFDKIKIDQSFTRANDPARADGIIRAINAIGSHLGMTTIAEGVETLAQMGDIIASGCGSAQGYFISRPVPAGEVAELLERLRGREKVDASFAVDAAALPAPRLVPPIDTQVAMRETGLYRLVYYSRNAIMGVDEEVRAAVASILTSSQRNNAAVGVTGALMFTDGYFAQVLEGQRVAVEEVFERIQLDERHHDVALLSFDAVDARLFPTWAMAFVGSGRAGHEKFGHYAATSGFDYAAADGDLIVSQLRLLLADEEKLTARAA